jgi:hypothetical protein
MSSCIGWLFDISIEHDHAVLWIKTLDRQILKLIDGKENGKTLNYDKDKYRQMILDAAETVLGYFGFNRTVYGTPGKNGRKKKQWYEELHEERTKDIQAEVRIEKQNYL